MGTRHTLFLFTALCFAAGCDSESAGPAHDSAVPVDMSTDAAQAMDGGDMPRPDSSVDSGIISDVGVPDEVDSGAGGAGGAGGMGGQGGIGGIGGAGEAVVPVVR